MRRKLRHLQKVRAYLWWKANALLMEIQKEQK
jgi:hypothetical protein